MGYVTKKAAQRFEEKKAAIYVRVSTQYQVDRASLPVQREELINYAKYALGISDYVIFEDAGYSAKNTDRPDYQQMMARMRTGEFSHLLVWKIDRISRNLLDFSVMVRRAERAWRGLRVEERTIRYQLRDGRSHAQNHPDLCGTGAQNNL